MLSWATVCLESDTSSYLAEYGITSDTIVLDPFILLH